MNVLMLNGSPRKRGNISLMMEAVRLEAEELGADVSLIQVSELQVKPCTGCMACRTRQECVLPADDAQRILRLIRACDVLVIGAPSYWGNMPGTLKLLFDRMVYGLMGESSNGLPLPLQKGKKAILLTTCTTPYPFNILFNQSRGTVKALKEIMKWSGFKVAASIEKGGTRKSPVGEKELRRCRKAIRKCMG